MSSSSTASSTVRGQVTYKRPVSKRLVFYDVLTTTPEGSSCWQEVVIKQDVYGSVQDIRNLRDTLKLGDVATFQGSYEQPPHHGFLAAGCIVVGRWAAAHPGVAFTPQPAPVPPPAPQQSTSSAGAGVASHPGRGVEEQQQEQERSQQQQQQQQQQQDNGDPPLVPGVPASATEKTTTTVTAAAAAAAAGGPGVGHHPSKAAEPAGGTAATSSGPAATIDVSTAAAQASPAQAAAAAVLTATAAGGTTTAATAAAAALGTAAGASPAAARASPGPVVQGPRLQVCKFWVNSGRCAKGEACPYAHTSLLAARRSWYQDRQSQRVTAAASMGFQHPTGAATKHHRAHLFCTWLVGAYGREWLNSGAGVVDVAGGRGAVSYELQVKHGIKVTLVDPRPFKLSREQLREVQQLGYQQPAVHVLQAEQLQSPDCSWEGCSVMPAVAGQRGQQGIPPAPVVSTATTDGAEAATTATTSSSSSSSNHSTDTHLPLQPGALQEQQQGQQAVGIFRQVVGWFHQDLWSTPGWQQLLGSCSLVLGMHPDQATEGILEYALQARKPFAIVPCCVFPRQYSHRRYTKADGSTAPVVAYAELVQYLLQRGAAAVGDGGGTAVGVGGGGPAAGGHHVPHHGVTAAGGAPPAPAATAAAATERQPCMGRHMLGAACVQVLAFEGANQVVYRPVQ